MQESMLQLLISMVKDRKVYVANGNQIVCGVVQSVEVEDGTRTGFNVGLVFPNGNHQKVYLKRPVGSGLSQECPIRSS